MAEIPDIPTPIPLHPAAVEAARKAIVNYDWDCREHGRFWSHDEQITLALTAAYEADPTIGALLKVAEAARDSVTVCAYNAPLNDEARVWCLNHHEWSPCPAAVLVATLAQLRAVEER